MDLQTLIGPNVAPEFKRALNAAAQEPATARSGQDASSCSRPVAAAPAFMLGYMDFPSFDLAHQHDDLYRAGFCEAWRDNKAEKEERRREYERYPGAAEIDRKNGL